MKYVRTLTHKLGQGVDVYNLFESIFNCYEVADIYVNSMFMDDMLGFVRLFNEF